MSQLIRYKTIFAPASLADRRRAFEDYWAYLLERDGALLEEAQALEAVVSNALVYTGKPALGESVGAAGLWQIILAAQALHSKELPPVLHADQRVPLRLPLSRTPIPSARRAIVLSCGLNQQAAGLRMAIQ